MDKHMTLKRRTAMAWIGAVPLLARAQGSDWSKQLAAARGQTVFFNAWGGSERINTYLQWAAAELQPAFGIRLHTSSCRTPSRWFVACEKAAGRSDGR
jgi:putative thiamine transport system substrate-binding protein